MKETEQPINLNFPIDASSVTPEWLTGVFRNAGIIRQGEITSIENQPLGPGEGYIGQLIRFKLGYSPTESGPQSLIAKFSTADPEIRAQYHTSGIYETEIRFYRELAQRVNIPAPQCYYSDIDSKTGYSILLLEDLAGKFKRLEFSSRNFNEAELVVKNLAKLHAGWWENPQLRNMLYLTPHNQRGEYWQEQFQGWWEQLPAKLGILIPEYQIPEHFFRLGERFGPNVAKIFTKMSERPITLIHKDAHAGNMMFSLDGKSLKFLDWQMVGYGLGIGDVTFFLVSSTPTELRQSSERDLLQTYHRVLVEQGVRGYDLEQCWADYELAYFKNLYTVAVLVGFLDTSSPEGKTLLRTLIPRVAIFCEEHDMEKYL